MHIHVCTCSKVSNKNTIINNIIIIITLNMQQLKYIAVFGWLCDHSMTSFDVIIHCYSYHVSLLSSVRVIVTGVQPSQLHPHAREILRPTQTPQIWVRDSVKIIKSKNKKMKLHTCLTTPPSLRYKTCGKLSSGSALICGHSVLDYQHFSVS